MNGKNPRQQRINDRGSSQQGPVLDADIHTTIFLAQIVDAEVEANPVLQHCVTLESQTW
jgi:hypothetical protein